MIVLFFSCFAIFASSVWNKQLLLLLLFNDLFDVAHLAVTKWIPSEEKLVIPFETVRGEGTST